jgi:beta-N-acetylhexosaminidase
MYRLMNRGLGPIMLDVAGLELGAEDRELLGHPLVGGLILFARNYADPAQLKALMTSIRELRPEILVAVDYEGGRVQRFRDGFTRLPAMRALGERYDQNEQQALQLSEDCGWLIGAELREFDIDLSFAPVLDLDGGVSGVIGDRAFHRNPDIVVPLALAFMRGMSAAGMCATGKHFPGHGQVAPDSHKELPVDTRSYEQLSRDLQPFTSIMKAGLPSVMMAHIQYPAIDALPASLSRHWVTERLRGACNFSGAVFTDDLSMGGAAAMGSYTERASLALAAGCDMLPVCNERAGVVELLDSLRQPQAVESQQRLSKLRASPESFAAAADHDRWQQAKAHLSDAGMLA